MKKDRRKPPLGHRAAPISFDMPLAIPDGSEHALDGIGASQALS